MKKLSILILVVGISFTALAFLSGPIDTRQEQNEKAVKEVIQKRYQGLNEMFRGDISTIKAIWSHEKDVSYLGPIGGIKVGWQEVLKDWEEQAAKKLGGKVIPSNMHYAVGDNMAVVVNDETGENVDKQGKPQKVKIRATHVLRKENGEWKIISEHLDKLPFLKQ